MPFREPWAAALGRVWLCGTEAGNGCSNRGELEDKFLRLTGNALGERSTAALFERLQRLEDEKNLRCRRSAVALDGALHSRQRLLQIVRIHHRRHLDLGVQPEEEALGDLRDPRRFSHIDQKKPGSLAAER
jgi:hypothetical protein